ncbi:unnamed protein product [Orchesella dallaii]|uniref:Uncharacterized protein n=1 Tax=Orchesella dallaii TaxID=48710 RepID=A0ABP1Q7E0_9HEXA
MDTYVNSSEFFKDQMDLIEKARQWTTVLNLRSKQQLQAMFQDNKQDTITHLAFPGYILEVDADNEFVFIRNIDTEKRRAICIYSGCKEMPELGESWCCETHTPWMRHQHGNQGRNAEIIRKTVRFRSPPNESSSSGSHHNIVSDSSAPPTPEKIFTPTSSEADET